MSQEEFLQKCRDKFGDEFDLSHVVYNQPKDIIKVVCKHCGNTFEMRANHFLYDKKSGCCPLCKYEKLRRDFSLSKLDFIKRAKSIHENIYDYSKTVYVNMHKPIIVTCKKHGDFFVSPQEHLKWKQCPVCALEGGRKYAFTQSERQEMFIEKAKVVHKEKNYDYSLVKYVDAKTKVEIVCPSHGSFFQSPTSHLHGYGCYMCKRSLGEEKVEEILKKYGIVFEKQYKVKNEVLFCGNKNLYVDFYIKDRKCFIEYNGQQHYRPTGYFGGKQKLIDTQERDMALRQYCKEHKIKLIEIPYWDFDKIEDIIKREFKEK